MEFYPTQHLNYTPNETDGIREVIFIRHDDFGCVCSYQGVKVLLEEEKLTVSTKN